MTTLREIDEICARLSKLAEEFAIGAAELRAKVSEAGIAAQTASDVPHQDWFTIKQASQVLGCSVRTVWRMHEKGELRIDYRQPLPSKAVHPMVAREQLLGHFPAERIHEMRKAA